MVMQSLLEQTADAVLKRVDTAPLAGKTVLLTGATGLIGVNLAAALRLAGAVVKLPHRDERCAGKYDFIIHAAGYAQPAKFMADPMATIRVNTTMLSDLLSLLRPEGRLLRRRGIHGDSSGSPSNPLTSRLSFP